MDKTQSDKFKKTARDLKTDKDEGRWKERLKKVAEKKSDSPKTK